MAQVDKMKGEQSERHRPKICLKCAYYKPQFFTVKGKECAMFTTTEGVKDNRCGGYAEKKEVR